MASAKSNEEAMKKYEMTLLHSSLGFSNVTLRHNHPVQTHHLDGLTRVSNSMAQSWPKLAR